MRLRPSVTAGTLRMIFQVEHFHVAAPEHTISGEFCHSHGGAIAGRAMVRLFHCRLQTFQITLSTLHGFSELARSRADEHLPSRLPRALVVITIPTRQARQLTA